MATKVRLSKPKPVVLIAEAGMRTVSMTSTVQTMTPVAMRWANLKLGSNLARGSANWILSITPIPVPRAMFATRLIHTNVASPGSDREGNWMWITNQ